MNIKLKNEWWHWLLIGLSFILAIYFWVITEGQLPVHWNLHGEVDRYGGKFESLLLLPIIMLVFYFILRYIPFLDPNKSNYEKFEDSYAKIRYALTTFLFVIHLSILLNSKGIEVAMDKVVLVGMGIFFFVIGMSMKDVRPNWFIGVRNPWTMSSRKSWDVTHKYAKWLFVGIGIGMVLASYFRSSIFMIIGFGVIFAAVIVLTVMSYVIWKHDPDRNDGANH
ncbi:SdpI family protein [bacterium]|nr:SdpI family protein [bacterium]